MNIYNMTEMLFGASNRFILTSGNFGLHHEVKDAILQNLQKKVAQGK